MVTSQNLKSNMSYFFHILVIVHGYLDTDVDHTLHEFLIAEAEINE